MMLKLFGSKTAWRRQFEVSFNATISVIPLHGSQKRQPRSQKIAYLRLDVASIRRNVQDSLDKGVGILRLQKRFPIQTASNVQPDMILADIASHGCVREVLIAVTWRYQSDEGREHYRPQAHVVSKIRREILKGR